MLHFEAQHAMEVKWYILQPLCKTASLKVLLATLKKKICIIKHDVEVYGWFRIFYNNVSTHLRFSFRQSVVSHYHFLSNTNSIFDVQSQKYGYKIAENVVCFSAIPAEPGYNVCVCVHIAATLRWRTITWHFSRVRSRDCTRLHRSARTVFKLSLIHI